MKVKVKNDIFNPTVGFVHPYLTQIWVETTQHFLEWSINSLNFDHFIAKHDLISYCASKECILIIHDYTW